MVRPKTARDAFAALASKACLFALLAGCDGADDGERTPPARPTTAPAPVAAPVQPPPPPGPLDRAGLIEAGRRAQAAFAAGRPLQDEGLSGRAFRIVVPFGCAGPVEDTAEARAGWRYDDRRKTLRVVYRPERLEEPGDEERRLVGERFPLPTPWMDVPDCPVPAPAPVAPAETARDADDPAPPPPPSARAEFSLVGLREPDESRAGRRPGDVLEVVRKAAAEEAPLPGTGLRLIVEGRVRAFPGGGDWRCSGGGLSAPPACELAVRVDRLAIARPGRDEPLGEWMSAP